MFAYNIRPCGLIYRSMKNIKKQSHWKPMIFYSSCKVWEGACSLTFNVGMENVEPVKICIDSIPH